MARRAGSDGERTEAAIRESALRLFARRGYEAVSMREIAHDVGVQAAAIYRYFPSKEALLYSLMREHMEALLDIWEKGRPANASPIGQLAAFTDNHIRFHIERRHATHVSNMELRSLGHESLTVILRLRSDYERELRAILRAGAERGQFAIEDVTLTAMAVIQMITGVIVWFRPDDRLSVEDVAKKYQTMTMRLAGVLQSQELAHVPALD